MAGSAKLVVNSYRLKKKCRSFLNITLCPDPPSMALNYPLHGGKPDAHTGKFFRAVNTFERLEHFLGEFHIEACTIIADEKTFRFFSSITPNSMIAC